MYIPSVVERMRRLVGPTAWTLQKYSHLRREGRRYGAQSQNSKIPLSSLPPPGPHPCGPAWGCRCQPVQLLSLFKPYPNSQTYSLRLSHSFASRPTKSPIKLQFCFPLDLRSGEKAEKRGPGFASLHWWFEIPSPLHNKANWHRNCE